ncbi:hypothetical protein KSP39_PZI021189 [Platanthera zijinensis]|uniref:Uncharacterized protein n=1 Tax=Platanthera zijinensis TaxID=2320716 RepID=A0AAP0AXK5_9ASPA
MADWGSVFVAVVLFVLLTHGLIVQIPGGSRLAEFANMQTSDISIFVHSIIYFAFISILLYVVGIHVYVRGNYWNRAPFPNLGLD